MPLRPQKDENTTRFPRSHVNSHRIRPKSASKRPERVQNYEILNNNNNYTYTC
jgi:hypothetical protein